MFIQTQRQEEQSLTLTTKENQTHFQSNATKQKNS